MAVWYWKTKCLSVLSTGGEAVLGRAPEICLSIIGLQIQNTPPQSRASRGPCERKKKNKPWLTQYSKITKSKQIEQITFKGWMRWRQASSESFVKERSQNNNRNNIWIAELGPLRKMSAYLILLGSFIKTSTENYFYAFPEGEKWISPNKSNITSVKHWALL